MKKDIKIVGLFAIVAIILNIVIYAGLFIGALLIVKWIFF
jgi:hypothetical protein